MDLSFLNNIFGQGGSGFGTTTQQYLTPNVWGNQMGSAWQNPNIALNAVNQEAARPSPNFVGPMPSQDVLLNNSGGIGPMPQGPQVDPATTQPVQNPAQGLMGPVFGALSQKQAEQEQPKTLGQPSPAVGNPYQGAQTRTSRMEPNKNPRNSRLGTNTFAGLLGGYFA